MPDPLADLKRRLAATGADIVAASTLDDAPEEVSRSQLRTERRSTQAGADELPTPSSPAPSSPVDQWLAGLNAVAPIDDTPDDTSLPPAAKNGGRIRYDLTIDDDHLTIAVRLQTRQSGGGWTGGRPLPLSRFRDDPDVPRDDVDRRVMTELTLGDDFDATRDGRPTYRLPPAAALRHLVGTDRLLLDGRPVRLRPGGPVLRWTEFTAADQRRMIRFDVVTPDDLAAAADPRRRMMASDPPHVVTGDTWAVTADAAGENVWFDDPGAASIRVLDELRHAPPVPTDRRDTLRRGVAPLQPFVSFLLPPALGGPVRTGESSLVVLLRRRRGEDGDDVVDYGIRFRDAAGRLRLPARGPLVSPVSDRDRPGDRHQAYRDADGERRRAAALVRRLERHADDATGWMESLSDMHEALMMIEFLKRERVDPHVGPVETMWDRNGDPPIEFLGRVDRSNVRVEVETRGNWFGIGGKIETDDGELPLAELMDGLVDDAAIEGDFVRLRGGGWIRIESRLRKGLSDLRSVAHADGEGLRIGLPNARAVADLSAVAPVHTDDAFADQTQRFDEVPEKCFDLPGGLEATLRDYQVEGFRWMARLAHLGIGGVLADDMGLGKTLQSIAMLVRRSKDGPALVVAPASVGENWRREVSRFAPGLNPIDYRNDGRSGTLADVGPGDVVIVSYGLLMRDVTALSAVRWSTLVFDEAQKIKNARSQTATAAAALSADWSLALSGTPMENHLGELWSILSVVSPGVLGDWETFAERLAGPIERDRDRDAAARLSKLVRPVILRRTKNEVLDDLPPRTDVDQWVDLDGEQRTRYESARREALADIREAYQHSDAPEDSGRSPAAASVLAALTRLRQLSCHPALVDDAYTGSSAKMDRLLELVDQIRGGGHRALVFSQFTGHLGLVRRELDAAGVSYQYLDGGTSTRARAAAVDAFQSGDGDVFLISLGAGGVGLNLTAADFVIHLDPWWNPAVENQATDRAHRIGQTRPVTVYRLIAHGTIEQEIMRLHADKRKLASDVLGGTDAAGKMDVRQWVGMLEHSTSSLRDE